MFKYINIKFLGICLLALSLGSCVQEDFIDMSDQEKEEEVINGNAIKLCFTLDVMGGTRSFQDDLENIQNYVDPEKFRVLFFDENDKFLFESKSRWVKIRQQDGNSFSWQVSVPFFSYGNDDTDKYDWDWTLIKNKITSKQFKIALLVNRPENEWYPGFKNTGDENASRYFDNTGPHWGRVNSIAYKLYLDQLAEEGNNEKRNAEIAKVGNPDIKDIFDIHHSQGDPIYNGKNYHAVGENGRYYDIVLGENMKLSDSETVSFPSMSSTSSWVDWEGSDPNGWDKRPTKLPSRAYPIPMYGVQTYEPINEEEWLEGTTFSLNRKNPDGSDYDKPISLLRSVARLDLKIPKDYTIEDCVLFYSNIYARCEPMNNWDPTDKIWYEGAHYMEDADLSDEFFQNNNDFTGSRITTCDEDKLMKYGPITENGFAQDQYKYDPKTRRLTAPTLPTKTTGTVEESRNAYWEKLAWLYGAWLAKDWDWGAKDHSTGKNKAWAQNIVNKVKQEKGIDPPMIMNSCIQRNEVVYVPKSACFDDGEYNHYVVYIGERNTNDPSGLNNIANTGSGNPTIMYWSLGLINKQGKKARYSIAIADYQEKYGPCYEYAAWRDITREEVWDEYRGSSSGGTYEFYGNGDVFATNTVPTNNMGVPSVDYRKGVEDVKDNSLHTYSCYLKGGTSTVDNFVSGSYGSGFMPAYQRGDCTGPLPIIRNHIYTITLVPDTRTRSYDDYPNFRIVSDVKRSPTIRFRNTLPFESANIVNKTEVRK